MRFSKGLLLVLLPLCSDLGRASEEAHLLGQSIAAPSEARIPEVLIGFGQGDSYESAKHAAIVDAIEVLGVRVSSQQTTHDEGAWVDNSADTMAAVDPLFVTGATVISRKQEGERYTVQVRIVASECREGLKRRAEVRVVKATALLKQDASASDHATMSRLRNLDQLHSKDRQEWMALGGNDIDFPQLPASLAQILSDHERIESSRIQNSLPKKGKDLDARKDAMKCLENESSGWSCKHDFAVECSLQIGSPIGMVHMERRDCVATCSGLRLGAAAYSRIINGDQENAAGHWQAFGARWCTLYNYFP